jgi:hypothetical protein
MKKCLWALFLLCIGAAVFADMAPAEVKADYGAAFRLRQEYWEKVVDLETLGILMPRTSLGCPLICGSDARIFWVPTVRDSLFSTARLPTVPGHSISMPQRRL